MKAISDTTDTIIDRRNAPENLIVEFLLQCTPYVVGNCERFNFYNGDITNKFQHQLTKLVINPVFLDFDVYWRKDFHSLRTKKYGTRTFRSDYKKNVSFFLIIGKVIVRFYKISSCRGLTYMKSSSLY